MTLPEIQSEDDKNDLYDFAGLNEKIQNSVNPISSSKDNSETSAKQDNPLVSSLKVVGKQSKYIAKTAFTEALGKRYRPQQDSLQVSKLNNPEYDFTSIVSSINSLKAVVSSIATVLTKNSNKKDKNHEPVKIAEKIIEKQNSAEIQTKPLFNKSQKLDESPLKQYALKTQETFTQKPINVVEPKHNVSSANITPINVVEPKQRDSNTTQPEPKAQQPIQRKEILATGQPVIRDLKSGRFVKDEQINQPKVAASTGESSTSSYRQNEKIEKQDKNVSIDSFSENAVKQIGTVFEEALQNMPQNNSTVGNIASTIGGFLGMGGKGVSKAAASFAGGAKNLFKGATSKILPKVAGAVDGVATSSKGVLSGLGNFAKGAGKLLPKAAKGLGVAAIPVTAALEAKDRIDQGQSQKQVVAGTIGSTAGGVAGAVAGAQGGALIGGGIGSLFGGIGAVPGAAIGSLVGGVGGAIGGSKVGGAIADHFTGGSLQKKQNEPLPKTKDLASLEKRQAQLKKKESSTPSVVSAPVDARNQTTVVNQKNTSMVAGGAPGKGSRGSLDLSKYGQH
ncbi:tail tape measure protein [Caulobacter phage Cr30]|uniref:tail tape measure protein n=1 Tax=Caulobacter phage Cr30 TaxID=1357714 RepID=UPI0004A9BAF0|nr:tail tape measure protein [Caulobacter phage Cr30]AGS81138.1 tail tape measure protein [Caulobacter phage Cr30]